MRFQAFHKDDKKQRQENVAEYLQNAGFFSIGVIYAAMYDDGKSPVARDPLSTLLRNDVRSMVHCLSIHVGSRSLAHCLSGSRWIIATSLVV
jgi:hypothetical protein